MNKKDERQFSPSILCPDCIQVVSVPMCNGCKHWHRGKNECDKYTDEIPVSTREAEVHDCEMFVLNPDSSVYKYVKANLERHGRGN